MSQTVITAAFEQWKAQEAAGGKPVVLDGFVLANVPGLNPDAPISNTEGMPPDAQIVYRQDVDKVGVVNNNAVVYSITMGSNVGTFDFNWIGLVNKASGTVAMIVHAPMQRKLKSEGGQQGNAVNRSFLMEYDGAATETQISTPAQTWQIDFTARLYGMDETLRLANVDIYGAGAFFGDGYLVTKTGAQYAVSAGSGYVGGIRTTLAAAQNIAVTTKPAKVWLDVSWQGQLTGQWHAVTTISISDTDLTDHTDANGFAHYVFAVAGIDASGAVKDLRPIGSLPNQLADDKVARAGDTMTGPLGIKSTVTVYEDDVNTISEFLYSYNEAGAQTKKVGIKAICDADGAGHWVVDVNPAAKGDSRVQALGIDGKSKLVASMNGFQLYEGTARVFSPNNPQLMFGVGIGPQHHADAYSTIGQIYRINGTSVSSPGNGVYGVVSLPCDGGPSTSYLAIQANGTAYVGWSNAPANGVTWTQVYTTKNPPTADDTGAVKKTGDTMTGQLIAPSFASTPETMPNGAGAFADQLSLQAPFFQPNWQWPVNAGGLFVPIAKGTSTRKDKGYPGAVSFGYLMPANDEHPHPTIHVKGDSNVDAAWDFNPYSGAISSKAGTFATQEWVNTAVHTNELHVGNAQMTGDGNIWGTRWDSNGGWLWDAIMWQVQNIGQMAVSGDHWWVKINLNGGTLIVQGGRAVGTDNGGGVTDRVNLNISVPNRLLHVSMNIKNFGQGYDSGWNPQVGDLTYERDGFSWFHGNLDRDIYWLAVGY